MRLWAVTGDAVGEARRGRVRWTVALSLEASGALPCRPIRATRTRRRRAARGVCRKTSEGRPDVGGTSSCRSAAFRRVPARSTALSRRAAAEPALPSDDGVEQLGALDACSSSGCDRRGVSPGEEIARRWIAPSPHERAPARWIELGGRCVRRTGGRRGTTPPGRPADVDSSPGSTDAGQATRRAAAARVAASTRGESWTARRKGATAYTGRRDDPAIPTSGGSSRARPVRRARRPPLRRRSSGGMTRMEGRSRARGDAVCACVATPPLRALGDGTVIETRDRGDSWAALRMEAELPRLSAPA